MRTHNNVCTNVLCVLCTYSRYVSTYVCLDVVFVRIHMLTVRVSPGAVKPLPMRKALNLYGRTISKMHSQQ